MLVHSLKMTVIPRHITGHLKVLADLASRVGQVVPSEWALSSEAFCWLSCQSPWGAPEVDVFANCNNHRLPLNIFPCHIDDVLDVDALKCSWSDRIMYLYKPSCILFNVIHHGFAREKPVTKKQVEDLDVYLVL